MELFELLTDNYFKNEYWHSFKLDKNQIDEYHKRLIMQGNILVYIDNGALSGYIEVWKINFEQLGRLLCQVPFYVFDENITDGKIAYISNMWVADDKRNELVNKKMVKDFFDKFGDCEYMLLKRVKWNNAFKVYPIKKFKGASYGAR